ncbi:MAG: polysaccharide biosynthesis tyrosine autokinase [Pirellulales bacterium]|nr:polysaccharide biosynthesis tyrosine autokinase [Pirellulales bacterium]
MHESHSQERPEGSHPLPASRSAVRPTLPPARRRPLPALDLEDGGGVSADFILSILRKWWRVVLPTGLALAAVSAVAVVYFHKPKYQAKALITIEAVEPYVAYASKAGVQSTRYVDTQVQMLQSPMVLGPVIARPEIAQLAEVKASPDPVEYLQSNLSIAPIGRSELYEIRYISTSGQDAATVCNAIVSSYLDRQSNEERLRTQRVIDVLNDVQSQRKDAVEERRTEVLELAKQVTGRDPFGQGLMLNVDQAVIPLASLHQSQANLAFRRQILQAEIQSLRDAPVIEEDRAASSGLLDLEIAGHAEVIQLTNAIEYAKAQMQDLQGKLVNNKWQSNPYYLKLKAGVEKMEADLSDLKVRLRSQVLQTRALVREEKRAQNIAQKENELKSLELEIKLSSDRYNEALSKLENKDVASVRLEFAKAALQSEERVYELIEGRKLALQTEMRAPDRVTLQLAATAPRQPMEPVPYKLLAVACAAAMCCPLGIAVLRELTVKKISTADQLVHEGKQRLLGEVARFPVRPVAAPVRGLNRRAQQEMFVFAESIDSVRTSLMLSEAFSSSTGGCVWAIVSAASGEGKTSVATSLAVSFAGATKTPTLIIDADLRAPDAAEVLGVPNRPGLAEVLADKVTLSDAIRRVGETNTYVLPAGRAKGNPHHLVEQGKIEKLLETLRPRFPHIVIDTPPVLAASESLIYAKASDYVVYCALRDVTRARQLKAAVSRLQDAGANLAGALLSGMPVSSYAYVYGIYGRES